MDTAPTRLLSLNILARSARIRDMGKVSAVTKMEAHMRANSRTMKDMAQANLRLQIQMSTKVSFGPTKCTVRAFTSTRTAELTLVRL